jgi:hypothetical protein
MFESTGEKVKRTGRVDDQGLAESDPLIVVRAPLSRATVGERRVITRLTPAHLASPEVSTSHQK